MECVFYINPAVFCIWSNAAVFCRDLY
eukprot:COSAG06_NODE_4948_length_3839_cov_3.741979_1_plen_26_part_10